MRRSADAEVVLVHESQQSVPRSGGGRVVLGAFAVAVAVIGLALVAPAPKASAARGPEGR
jgi:hypothetical protein